MFYDVLKYYYNVVYGFYIGIENSTPFFFIIKKRGLLCCHIPVHLNPGIALGARQLKEKWCVLLLESHNSLTRKCDGVFHWANT